MLEEDLRNAFNTMRNAINTLELLIDEADENHKILEAKAIALKRTLKDVKLILLDAEIKERPH